MPLFKFTRHGGQARGSQPHSPLPWIALIALILGAVALGFAWLAGWIGRDRLTAQNFTDAIEATGANHPGFRRAHSKGVCVNGWFEPSAQAPQLSHARMFEQQRVPVLGRLSIGGGNPHGADNSARVRSIAMQLSSDDGQQWRMAMNSFPFLAVATPEAFYEQTRAQIPDPATGKPDPVKLAAIQEKYPSARAFTQWAKTAPWTDSWASTEFNSVNSFWFTNAQGQRRAVRWRWQPQATPRALDAATREQAGVDFLSQDLQRRLAQGPIRWNLVVTLASTQDAINDPSMPWPAEREQVTAGVLTIERMQPQEQGSCNDLNFDPLILPEGVEGSDDPILAARSAVYSQSFNRRERERATGEAARDNAQVQP
jgi:catalase